MLGISESTSELEMLLETMPTTGVVPKSVRGRWYQLLIPIISPGVSIVNHYYMIYRPTDEEYIEDFEHRMLWCRCNLKFFRGICKSIQDTRYKLRHDQPIKNNTLKCQTQKLIEFGQTYYTKLIEEILGKFVDIIKQSISDQETSVISPTVTKTSVSTLTPAIIPD